MRIGVFLKAAAVSVIMVGASAIAGQAATFNGIFSLSGNSFNEPGLVMGTSTQTGSMSFQLNVGQSATVDLFDIWATERRVNGNNTRTSTLQAAFDFAGIGASGTAAGSTTGIGGAVQYASLTWGAPLLLNFGNGGLLSIVLNNANFSSGFGGLTQGPANGATISATATLISAPVPLPASGLLLAGALGGASVLRRRRRAA